jgi:phosphatidylethanolamine/phosphatidyl-N-methylethanolamine N-methyltransferase
MLSTIKIFYQNVFSHLETTGSLAPSSPYLSAAMIEMIELKDEPRSILEVGPGTGPFTVPLVRMLQDGDILDLCELNEDFVTHIKKILSKEDAYHQYREHISIYNKPVQELDSEKKYDYIVSSLPFNNFPPVLVDDILKSYMCMLKPGGKMSFFEYAFVRQLKKGFVKVQEKQRIHEVGVVINNFVEKYAIRKKIVRCNFPPARVYICQFL